MRLCYEMRMDFSNIEQRRIFFEIHEGLPRQSPGSTLSTLKALDLVAGVLTETPFIADMACGPGASALVLGTALPHAKIIGVDLHQPFLDEFAARARREDLQERIETHCGDMLEPLPDAGACELIWCEGGIYNVGVGAGLLAWRNSLKPGGLVVFNEVVWLVDEDARADPVRDFWRAYPSMTDIAGVESAVESADYELLGGFNLPESDWWDAYYAPLEARLCEVEAKYGQSEDAAPPIAHTREEIDLRRRFADAYNYRFFAARMR